MPAEDITIMPLPQPCAVCGRPTTQFSERIRAPYCGRDGGLEPDRRSEPDSFGPSLVGKRRWWRRSGGGDETPPLATTR